MMQAFLSIFKRDILLAFRHRSELANPMLFFVLVISLFPLALGPYPEILQQVAPGVIWVAALLATLLSLERLFREDFMDGSLEQMLLSHHSTVSLVLAKILAHWCITGLPLLIIAPLLALFLGLPSFSWGGLLASLALGTPILSFVGAIGVALTLGLHRGGILLSLLVLPLYIPVLIFGTGVVDAARMQLPFSGQLLLLAAMLVLAMTLTPLATVMALRISVA